MALNILDFPTKRSLPKRTRPIAAVVLHTTGATDLDQILRFYTDPNGYQPHYLIETTGSIRRIADEGLIAWHAKIAPLEAQAYGQGWDHWSKCVWVEKLQAVQDTKSLFPGYASWDKTWRSRGINNPLQLVTGASPNAVSVGIELQQPDKNSVTPVIFTPAQYDALDELLLQVCSRNHLARKRGPIIGHYDCSPMRRSTAKGGWDPGEAFDWARVIPGDPL